MGKTTNLGEDTTPEATILLVDDDVELCELLQEFSRVAGFDWKRCSTAVAVWRGRSAAGTTWCCLT